VQTNFKEYASQLQVVFLLRKKNTPVEIDTIPYLFKDDFNRFFMGDTLQGLNGKVVIGSMKYDTWVKKLWNTGLDYVIYLENS